MTARDVLRRSRDETGSVLVTALISSVLMLMLGLALLAVVDTQADQSAQERSRDKAFNLAESVLTSEAFVLSRNFPASVVLSNPTPSTPTASVCSAAAAGYAATVGVPAPAGTGAALIQNNINATYTDAAYAGAEWQVNLCDDTAPGTVWTPALLNNQNWDANANGLIWVRAQATVAGRLRVVAGLVKVRTSNALESRWGLASGSLNADLGTTVNNLSSNVLGGVLSGLLGDSPLVAPDPNISAASPPSSGVTGLRCGALDVQAVPTSTCVSGTIGATQALPALNTLLTGGSLTQFPSLTGTDPANVDQLRAQAIASRTYYKTSAGSSNPATAPACDLTSNTGTPSAATVVFIEQVGTSGTARTNGGPGDQYCAINVRYGVQWKAVVVGAGRIIIRGDNTTTPPPAASSTGPVPNTFSGVVYALNQQRLDSTDGGNGQNLGDSASSPREVVRIDQGARVKGAVYADGKSGRVGMYPPPLTLVNNTLIDFLVPCTNLTTCATNNTLKLVTGGLNGLVTALISTVGLTYTVNGILNQLSAQRASYGSSIIADTAAINALKVYSTSSVVPGTFLDLNPAG